MTVRFAAHLLFVSVLSVLEAAVFFVTARAALKLKLNGRMADPFYGQRVFDLLFDVVHL